jgi:NAD(P)-dependent dehydrogenase (short-subunit alcohol dehydrogenase family)
MKNVVSLDQRRIIITGAARGLGRAYAEQAARAGARLVLADILQDVGQATADEIKATGAEVYFEPLDLAQPDSVEALAVAAAEHLGGIDGLINNGAIATGIGGETCEEIDIETWDRVMNVNVRGTWLMIKACLPYLRKAGNGKIVNVASDTAIWGAPNLLHYVSSKGAVIAMTRSLARELGPDGISINAIAPGLTLVEATEYVPEVRHRFNIEARSMPRAMVPDDVVGPVMYLLSDAADFVTGQLLPANGGFVFN